MTIRAFGYGTDFIKLTESSLKPEELGEIDVILLSHAHHEDKPDRAGRPLLPLVNNMITTSAGARRQQIKERSVRFAWQIGNAGESF